ncbi:MAG: hypothetical protein M1550_04620 [Deltaproteobacteria bacterium]|nr:hypothetical protein [Deltaproteobacteria bacterium]
MPDAGLSRPGSSGGRRRKGSRLLLALALLAGIAAAVLAGTTLSGFIADRLGIASLTARLTMKAMGIAVALPAGFYLVELFFLRRASRDTRE